MNDHRICESNYWQIKLFMNRKINSRESHCRIRIPLRRAIVDEKLLNVDVSIRDFARGCLHFSIPERVDDPEKSNDKAIYVYESGVLR